MVERRPPMTRVTTTGEAVLGVANSFAFTMILFPRSLAHCADISVRFSLFDFHGLIGIIYRPGIVGLTPSRLNRRILANFSERPDQGIVWQRCTPTNADMLLMISVSRNTQAYAWRVTGGYWYSTLLLRRGEIPTSMLPKNTFLVVYVPTGARICR
ncbi:hypothetical protein AG1IA_03785 [Rhizoctonia solani AG-1 IA]|uniref:Uncharacterized protein n=1 Tax=Thanatephorus cucumeris (strain AG1-IA) TaxID=983506 RepID=L8WVR4_THACA|nr:hypothetical protein AG1IA_03785 [Rhizoctonia solani AG-1 IA]